MHDLEQLMVRTAFAPVGPLDLDAVERRGARRHTAQLAATFAGAIAAIVFAMSLVGTTLPTSAPVIGEAPERGETVDAAPAEAGGPASVEAVDTFDQGSASAESVGVLPAPLPATAQGGARDGGPAAGESEGWHWTFDEDAEGWEWEAPAGVRQGWPGVARVDEQGCGRVEHSEESRWRHRSDLGAMEVPFHVATGTYCQDGFAGSSTVRSGAVDLTETRRVRVTLFLDLSQVDWQLFESMTVGITNGGEQSWTGTALRSEGSVVTATLELDDSVAWEDLERSWLRINVRYSATAEQVAEDVDSASLLLDAVILTVVD